MERTGSLSEGQNRRSSGGPLRDASIQPDLFTLIGTCSQSSSPGAVAYVDDG
jgi:hypothetical protein